MNGELAREPRSYRVEETFTWQDRDAYRIARALHGAVSGGAIRGLSWFQRALGLFFAILGGALAGLSLLSGRPGLLTAMGAAMLYFGIREFRKKETAARLKLRDRYQRELRKTFPDTPMRFLLEEDGFSVWEPSGSASYRYHALDAVWEDGERYYLLLPEGKFLALQKRAFTQGDPSAFRSFLEEKTGRSVETIR